MKIQFPWKDWVAKIRELTTGSRFRLPKSRFRFPKFSWEKLRNWRGWKVDRAQLENWRDTWKVQLAALPSTIAQLPNRFPRDINLSQDTLTYINVAAVIICAYFAADLANTVISPLLPEPAAKKVVIKKKTNEGIAQFDIIAQRNLFNKDGKIPEDQNGMDINGAPVKSNLPLDLMGIILLRDNLKSVASVADRSKNDVVAVKVNDPIGPQATVQQIEETRVIFLNRATGRREYIELPEDLKRLKTKPAAAAGAKGAGITKIDENHMVVDRAEVDKSLADLNTVLTQARCVPNLENGRPAGFRCFQIVPGSIFEKIGMQNGDVVCGINGQELNDITQALGMFEALKTSSSLELCIKRNRQTMNIQYDIQ